MNPVIIGLIFVAFICFAAYTVIKAVIHIASAKRTRPLPAHEQEYTTPVTPYSEAEEEGMRQAKMVMDRDTYVAIKTCSYNGKLPERQPDGKWSDMYPDIKCMKIAGINFRTGLNPLVDQLIECYLVEEPDNEFDPDAIKIIHKDTKKHLGYVPADKTDWMRSITKQHFPYPCKAIIQKFTDYDEMLDKEKEFLTGRIIVKKATSTTPQQPTKSTPQQPTKSTQ